MPEPARIRNVAVVGHRGTGKTSLVEALLFQTGKINRLGTVEAGTTVSDADEDEHKRQLSISMSLAHTDWQGRKINLVDVPGDPSFQGEARCALRVVEGALVVVSGVMGLEVGTARVKKLADDYAVDSFGSDSPAAHAAWSKVVRLCSRIREHSESGAS